LGITYQAAVISVSDMPSSVHFYRDLMGQVVSADHGPVVLFAGGFALWEMKHMSVTVFSRHPGRTAATAADNLELYFECERVDEVMGALEKEGVRILDPVREQSWGQRTFRCTDPDGHIIEVAEPMNVVAKRLFCRGVQPSAVSAQTGLPLEAVLQSIGYPRF